MIKTGRLLVVHEACQTGGWAGEVIAAVTGSRAFDYLDAPVRRLAGKDIPIPYNRELEHAAVPQEEDIEREIRAIRERKILESSPMPIPFIMPKFDMDQEKATIVSWSKEEGEFIQAEETALVVETEKVAIDVPAPATGKLAGIRFQAGDTVPVTTVIAFILQEGETLADLPGLAEPAAVAGMHPAEPVSDHAAASAAATPVAARLAKEKGVDLSRVRSKGERITRQDVERYLTIQAAPAMPADESRVSKPATPSARRLAREAGVRLESISGSGPRGRVQAVDVSTVVQHRTTAAPVMVKGRPAQVVLLAGMRQKIAERMTASFHDIPHISLTVEADVSALEATRAQLSALAERDGAGKVSLTAVLVKVVAWALERNPYVNASLQEGRSTCGRTSTSALPRPCKRV